MADENCTTKHCTRCGEEKPATLEFFYWNKTRNNLYPHCKSCHNDLTMAKYVPKRIPKETVKEGYRRCSHCQKEFLANREWFYANKKSKTGLSSWCKHCTNLIPKHQRQMGIFPKKPRTERHRQQDRDRRKTPEYKSNKRASNHTYKARKKNAQGTHTGKDIDIQFRSQRGKCWHCGKKLDPDDYHVDHLTPLSRGGSNAADNIVITCPHCNMSKNDRLTHEWNGRLL